MLETKPLLCRFLPITKHSTLPCQYITFKTRIFIRLTYSSSSTSKLNFVTHLLRDAQMGRKKKKKQPISSVLLIRQ